MKPIEKELDRLVQQLSQNQRCHICGIKDATAVHHIIGRANPNLRYELPNLLPVCYECHRDIHDGKIDVKKHLPPEIWEYLQEVKNRSYKDFLIFYAEQTEDEYFQSCKKFLLKVLERYKR